VFYTGLQITALSGVFPDLRLMEEQLSGSLQSMLYTHTPPTSPPQPTAESNRRAAYFTIFYILSLTSCEVF